MEDNLYGERRFLEPLFEQAVEVVTPSVSLKGKRGSVSVQVRNNSDISFELVADGELEGIKFSRQVTLLQQATVLLRVSVSSDSLLPDTRTIELPYRVNNLHLTPEETLPVRLPLEVTYLQEKKE